METQLSKLEQLLKEFRQLPPIDVAEPSIFSIGSKGYYENPTTDILAFFCDSNGQHKLGAIVLKALLYCLQEEYHQLDHALAGPPEREVTTKTGKRIDLLLEGTNWVMLLENKIYHQQNNPFSDYEKFIQEEQETRFSGKTKLFVVLSPAGEKPHNGWHGISYPTLISALKVQLAEQFISQPINKWSLLLREFILHLESLMSQPSVNQQTRDFVLKNLASIKEMQQTKLQAINEYHQHLQTELQNKLGQDVVIRLHNWNGYPALRFALSNWKDTDSDVVLFLSGEADKTTFNVYASLRNGLNEHKVDSLILTDKKAERWLEGGKKIRVYSVKEAAMKEEQIVQFICARLLELDQLEQDNHLTTG
ncbi:PD-(D/E)XK nuclease superfamily protein [Arsukibacterium tuosuense]|uniref:PD-(D/E)XK nuclease superfamily protein n=1 Tax=Arsukibacterium tuosuense TaxID=1323745 RepID=A0A285JGZ0_9GAMM|nr:PD-(D/E)XK nuclease family protein [Arsukibacterium tuosuense]SNY58411.1 PD-(D/E)XK nuclease superfamily protein [Arsukibacterium tuosuense]